jgi:hypothetical protein
MVRRALAPLVALGCVLAAAACQVLFGIEDKHLAESPAPADAGPDVLPDSGTGESSTHDAVASDADVALDAEDAQSPIHPPGRPDAAAVPSDAGITLTLGARTFYQGTIDPANAETTFEAWRQFGFDLDDRCTTAEQSQTDTSGVCTRPAPASKFSQEDGLECRDNAAGRLIGDAFKFLSVDYEKTEQVRSHSGDNPSLILQIFDLDPGPDDGYAPARLYISAPRKSGENPPLWNGMDSLRVDSKSVADGGLDAPLHVFPNGYVTGNVWVSGDFRSSPMAMPILLVHHLRAVSTVTSTLTVQLDPAHKSASRSVLSSVMSATVVGEALRPGILELVQCDSLMAQSVMNQYVIPSTDLSSSNPSFIDPAKECDLMSLGMQVEWVPVKAPTEVVAVPVVNLCDAGPG